LRVFSTYKDQLGHYFRHLYHLLKFTDEAIFKGSNKKYIDIIQAQMSDDELYLMFYNCISELGKSKVLTLIDEYSFLENIRSRGEIFDNQKRIFYPKTKFKNNSDKLFTL
jgi:hypothetical protein